MEELFERVLALVISGPKRFLAARLGAQELTLERGLVFVAVSFMIG